MTNKISDYILNHSKKANNDLKYDFMPQILQIIERPAHKAGKFIIYAILSMLIIVILWASIARTDIVVTAGGNIIPEGDIITMKSYISGTVEEINVSEGQFVKEGDLLISLNSDIKTDIAQLNNEIKIISAELDVYEKILNHNDILKIKSEDFDIICQSYVESIIANENDYLISRKLLLLSQKSAEQEYALAVTTAKSYEGTDLYETQSHIVEQKKKLEEEARLNLERLDVQHSQELNNNYSQKKSELSNLNSQLNKCIQNEKYTQITASEDGYIANISVNSVGDTVGSYEELIVIVPKKNTLQMKGYIQNRDMANVKIGDVVQIKLDAYTYSDYGTISGKVIYISPTSSYIQNTGSFYEIIAEIENTDKKINLISGLSGTMEIKTGERTILSYFLDPVLNVFDNSLKEK